jgi:hypothetical protein
LKPFAGPFYDATIFCCRSSILYSSTFTSACDYLLCQHYAPITALRTLCLPQNIQQSIFLFCVFIVKLFPVKEYLFCNIKNGKNGEAFDLTIRMGI